MKIAQWENSYEFSPYPIVIEDFTGQDEDKFFIKITVPGEDNLNINATLSSFEENANTDIDNPLDQILNISLTSEGNGIYLSQPLIAVVDNDEYDDDFSDYFSIDPFDGDDDGSDDKTIYVKLKSILKLTYTIDNNQEERIIHINNDPVKKIKLNIISMKDVDGIPIWTKQEILDNLQFASATWSQCPITFVNNNCQEISLLDIQEVNQPEGVNLMDGLSNNFAIPDANFDITVEEKALLDNLKDDNGCTLDIIFMNKIRNELEEQETAKAYAINSLLNSDAMVDVKYINTVFVSQSATIFTSPHEIGHVLTNKTHYGIQSSEYQYPMPSPLPLSSNLMRGVYIVDASNPPYYEYYGTSVENGVYESKRLITEQCNDANSTSAFIECECNE